MKKDVLYQQKTKKTVFIYLITFSSLYIFLGVIVGLLQLLDDFGIVIVIFITLTSIIILIVSLLGISRAPLQITSECIKYPELISLLPEESDKYRMLPFADIKKLELTEVDKKVKAIKVFTNDGGRYTIDSFYFNPDFLYRELQKIIPKELFENYEIATKKS